MITIKLIYFKVYFLAPVSRPYILQAVERFSRVGIPSTGFCCARVLEQFVSYVTDMSGMFCEASSVFNQDVSRAYMMA